jgi:hypothetical protein
VSRDSQPKKEHALYLHAYIQEFYSAELICPAGSDETGSPVFRKVSPQLRKHKGSIEVLDTQAKEPIGI